MVVAVCGRYVVQLLGFGEISGRRFGRGIVLNFNPQRRQLVHTLQFAKRVAGFG